MKKTIITTIEATDIVESNQLTSTATLSAEIKRHLSKVIGFDDMRVKVQIFNHDAVSCIAAEPRSEWTPVTPATMPANCEDVLLCSANGERIIGHAMHLVELTADNNKKLRYLWRFKSPAQHNYTPVAWAPLPEPYTPKE